MKPSLFIAPFMLLAFSNARADWVDPGAAYRCDPDAGSFSIVSVMHTSSPEGPGTVKAPPGFSTLAESGSVQCTLVGTKVGVRFRVRPPRATGMCGGITQITLAALHVDDKEVLELRAELFNHYCLEQHALHSIEVRKAAGRIQVEICRAAWSWNIGYDDVQCKARDL